MGGYSNNNLNLGQTLASNTNTSVDVESGLIDYTRKNKGIMKPLALLALGFLVYRVLKKGR